MSYLYIRLFTVKYSLAKQPVVKQVKEAFAEMSADWKKGEEEMKAKMDSIIELQCMRLDLERERLQFEREKFSLPSRYLYFLGKCTNQIL